MILTSSIAGSWESLFQKIFPPKNVWRAFFDVPLISCIFKEIDHDDIDTVIDEILAPLVSCTFFKKLAPNLMLKYVKLRNSCYATLLIRF